MEKIKEKLVNLAKKQTHMSNPDFCSYDACGGNFDDAFEMGMNDGEIYLARRLLKDLFDMEEGTDYEIEEEWLLPAINYRASKSSRL